MLILRELGRCDAGPDVDGILHIIVIDDGLLHLSHLAENGLLLFAISTPVGSIVILLVYRHSVIPVTSPKIHEVLVIWVIFKCALLKTIDCEGLFEVIASESGGRSMLINAFLPFLSYSGSGQEFTVFALFQTFNPFTAGGRVILFFDFLDSHICLAGLQF